MSSQKTRKRLLDAAERAFAELGYTGASVRKIAALAGADPGAVRYHFGSKDGLFGEVLRRRIEPLCEERLRLLELARRGRQPVVAGIVEAFLLPAVQLITHETHGQAWVRLLSRVRVEPGRYLDGVQPLYTRLLREFHAALVQALPEVPPDEISYRLHFMFGMAVGMMVDDGALRVLGAHLEDVDSDPEGVLQRLVGFVSAGIGAPPPRGPSPFGAEPPAGARRNDLVRRN